MFSAGQSNVPMFVEPTPPILNTSFSTPNPTFPALTREAQTPYQTTTLHPNFWNTYNSLLSKKSNSSVVPTETLKVWIDDPLRFHSNLLKLILDNLSVSFEYNWLFLELANQMLEFTYDSKSDFHQAFVQNLLNLNVLSLDSIDYLQALLKVFIRLVARHVSLIMLYPSISQVLEVTLMHSDPSLSTLSLQLCFNLSRYFFLNHQKSNVLDTKDDKEDEEFIISWFSGLLQLLLPMLLPEDIIESTFSTLFYSICFCLSLGYPSFKDLLFTFLPKHDLTSKKSWLKSHRIPEDVNEELEVLAKLKLKTLKPTS
ncbi:hypothetical protein HMI56_000839 [Coelomomyces lativittatus]|nr:hypothetical protein HMI56_000839 [Coelomomyces lativittatus]